MELQQVAFGAFSLNSSVGGSFIVSYIYFIEKGIESDQLELKLISDSHR